MKKTIAYVSINSSYSHSTPVYGQLRALAEQKLEDHFEWNFFECSINDNSDMLLEKLIDIDPELIFSTAYLFNTEALQKTFKKISLLIPKAICVMGGPEFLGDNQNFLNLNRNIASVFRGDESSFPKFLKNYKNPDVWTEIEGLCFIDKNGNYIDNGTASFNGNLDDLPSPYEKGYFLKEKPFVHYESARGCVSKCSFCTSSISAGVKLHGVKRVESDLNILHDAGIREIRILDRTFNVPEKRAIELTSLFSSKFPDIKFHVEIDPSKLTDKVITALNSTPKGQFHIEAGVQTFNCFSLKNINRNIDTEKLTSNLKSLTESKNYALHMDIIAGLPKQKYSDIIEDVRKLVEIGPEEIQLEVLKILQGTPIANDLQNEIKWSPSPPYEVLFTPDLSFGELSSIKILSRIIDSYYNVEGLRNLFRFAITRDMNFLSAFLNQTRSLFVLKDKPSLRIKLNSLFEYAKSKNNPVLEGMVTFAACLNGCLSEELKNVKMLKGSEIDDLKRCFATNLLWKNGEEIAEKPVCSAEFNFNAGDLFLNPLADIRAGNFRYLFYYSKFGISGKSVKIENVSKISQLT